ncbi:MAG: homoserine dehydrogenase [Planctomycetes bacterium]|jgi:homoserine dehydrogenase|nr:homoserine dehydrogenase [Planctomycetota bacterium]
MPDAQQPLGVVVVGCGTVGGEAAQLLSRDGEMISRRVGRDLQLRRIVDVNVDHARQIGIAESLLTSDLDAALADGANHVVLELVGGTTLAKEITEKALRAGKHVVTANKALLAHHGPELYAIARARGVCMAFEASCAGGVPIIAALKGGLIANRIDALYGIVNGTCNYILTQMIRNGTSYPDALAGAQADGLAEADPTLDVSGGDSAHKLAIMAAMAFGVKVDFGAIPTAGIDTLELCDVRYGETLGYVVKLLAIAQQQPDGLSLRVRPAFISKNHPLAWVSGPFNAVSVYGHATGHTMYYGRGAGGLPTASAVLADVAAVALGNAQNDFEQLGIWPDRAEPASQLPIDAVRSRYYLRIVCEDRPGVFAQVARILGRRDISISSVLQQEANEDVAAVGVPVVITTATALEGNLTRAIDEVDALDVAKAPTVCIPIVDEHPERVS